MKTTYQKYFSYVTNLGAISVGIFGLRYPLGQHETSELLILYRIVERRH